MRPEEYGSPRGCSSYLGESPTGSPLLSPGTTALSWFIYKKVFFFPLLAVLTVNHRFILPVLAEYSDSGHREPYGKLMYSLRSNAQFHAMVLGSSAVGLIYIFITYGFSLVSLKSVIMALAYCWGLVFAIYLMGHGLVSIPRRLFRNASVSGRLRRLQSHAPALHEKMEDSLLTLEDIEAQVIELSRRKVGSARDFSEWIEELVEMGGLDEAPSRAADNTLGGESRLLPTVITEQYMANLTREFIRARHARSRYVGEWNRLVQKAAELQAVLDSAASKKLDFGEDHSQTPPWARVTVLTPYSRYLLHFHIMPYVRLFGGVVLSLASACIVWSEVVKVALPNWSVIRFTVVHHWVGDKGQVGFAGQLLSMFWILYMCTATLTSMTEVKVWRGRALTRRNTAYESAFWYSQQVAKLSVPLSYNYMTLLSPKIYKQTVFYGFLGQLIDFTPLGRWFDYVFPILILFPVFATLFGIYGRVKRLLGFGIDLVDDEEEGGRRANGIGLWREGRDLIGRDLSGHALSRRREDAIGPSGRSAPILSIPSARGAGASSPSPLRSPARSGHARRLGQNARDQAYVDDPTGDENFFQLLGHRMKNTIDGIESPRWLQDLGEGIRNPPWANNGEGASGNTNNTNNQPDFRRWFGGGGGNDEGRIRL